MNIFIGKKGDSIAKEPLLSGEPHPGRRQPQHGSWLGVVPDVRGRWSLLWEWPSCVSASSAKLHQRPIHSTANAATFIVHTTYGIFLFLIKMSKDWLTKRWMKLQKEDRILSICLHMPHPHPRKLYFGQIVNKSYSFMNVHSHPPHTCPASLIFQETKCCFTCIWVSSFHILGSYPFDENGAQAGSDLLQSQNPETLQPKSCVFWRVKGGCLESVYPRTRTLSQMNLEACSLNYVKVSSKRRVRGLSKLLNSRECQTLFLNRVCHCQVCNVNIVFCYLTSKDRRVDEGLGRAQVNFISRNLRRHCDTIVWLKRGVPGRRLEYFDACFSLFNWKKKMLCKMFPEFKRP